MGSGEIGPLDSAPPTGSMAVQQRMKGQRRQDTGCEMKVGSILHRRGLRFRVNCRVLPDFRRRADLVYTRAKVAVFADGCFWHGCPVHVRTPRTHSEWWQAKTARNARRDRDSD
jgi:DNA mismatch endonuclease, patch repair protein